MELNKINSLIFKVGAVLALLAGLFTMDTLIVIAGLLAFIVSDIIEIKEFLNASESQKKEKGVRK